MIDTRELESWTCKVINPGGMSEGTAFFIDRNLLLTSLHVVKDFVKDSFHVEDPEKRKIQVSVKGYCTKTDLALLITEDHTTTSFATLCNEIPVVGTSWASFGHPMTSEGQAVGTKLEGDIFNVITREHDHDISLRAREIVFVREHRGFSGSGVINPQKQVTSILRFVDTNTLNSISVRKAEGFLKSHGVSVTEDQLTDFSSYIPDAFQAVADPFKGIAIASANMVMNSTSPQAIASSLEGRRMFPVMPGTIKDIVAYLKSQPLINQHLWLAWLEFLSYVQMVKGEYSDINTITIFLPQAEVSKFIGVETKINQDITLTLQFFFTEGKEYFSIAKQYLLNNSIANSLQHNHCHVFHSHTRNFGFQPLTKEEKKKIVQDISSPQDAGLNIAGQVDYGVLSFSELSMKVQGSKTISEATINLIQIFTNAIS